MSAYKCFNGSIQIAEAAYYSMLAVICIHKTYFGNLKRCSVEITMVEERFHMYTVY